MPKEKLNFNIFYKELEEKKREWDYIIKFAELTERNKINELREIIVEIFEPEKRFLTST